MGDAQPQGGAPPRAELQISWRDQITKAIKLWQKHFLLTFVVGGLVVNRMWFSKLLDLLLRWISGNIYYYKAYWFNNVSLSDNIQRYNRKLREADDSTPGSNFCDKGTNQEDIIRVATTFMSGWSIAQWTLASVIVSRSSPSRSSSNIVYSQ